MKNEEFVDNNNIMNLKEINEDNILEEEEEQIDEKEDFENKKMENNKIRYKELLNFIKERVNPKYLNYNEFLCHILLMPSNIDILDKLTTLSLKSYCYQENKKIQQIYHIARIFEQNVNYLTNVDPMIFVRVFFRAAFFFKDEGQFIHAMKYINKSINIIKKYIKNSEDKKDLYLVEQNYTEISIGLNKYLKNSINILTKEDYFSSPIIKQLKQIIELILENKYNLDVNDEDFLYVINKKWLVRLNNFIEDYEIAQKTNIEDFYFNKAFDFAYFLDFYFRDDTTEAINKSKGNNIKFTAFPGKINNYYITDFKDHWKNYTDADENFYIKKDLKLNEDYFLIKEKDWKLLNTYFGSTNEILRRKKNLDLIQLKFILFDKRINNEKNNLNLLKLKYIQFNPNITLKELEEKIINIVNDSLEKKEDEIDLTEENEINVNNYNSKNRKLSFYTLNKEKKEILIEMCFSFIIKNNKYDCMYIDKLDLNEKNEIQDLFLKYNNKTQILIIEIIENNKDCFFEDIKITMKKKYKCTICNKNIKNLNEKYKCHLCNFSLFCSEYCSNKSSDHLDLDKRLEEIIQSKINISKLLSLDFDSLLIKNRNNGRVGLLNFEKSFKNTGFVNSCLQCLSNTEDLTKFFLIGDKEINNDNLPNNKMEITKAYQNLIIKMWKGKNELIIPEQFITAFFDKEESFKNQKQYDSQEFLNALLKYLHDDLNRVINKQKIEIKEKQKEENDEQASNRYWEYNRKRDDSIITDLFCGQYKFTTKCSECGYNSISFEEFNHLSLPIPNKKMKIQIKLLLYDGNFINLKVILDKNIELKDLIQKAILNLNNNKYFKYLDEYKFKNNIINYNNTKIPINILYNNIIVVEFSSDIKMTNIYKTSYKNIINKRLGNNNEKINNDINIKISNDNKKLINIYENNKNRELVLFERDISFNNKDIIDIFVYPIMENENNNNSGFSSKIILLSYPIVICINKENTLSELKTEIFNKFSKILKSEHNISKNILICFPHLSENWEYLKYSGKNCPLCGELLKKNVKYCMLSRKYKKNMKISQLISRIGNVRPLILYGKSKEYDLKSELYKKMKLFPNIIKNETEKENHLSLYDSLEFFSKEEVLIDEGKWFCKKCIKYQKGIKTIEIYKTPIYLIIYLKKFKQKGLFNSIFGSKNETFIKYRTTLDLKDFVIGPDKEKSKYSLYGVVVQNNIINESKCFSFCINQGEWLTYYDNLFGYCKNPINKDAYILFYKKIND